jgi:L-histidine N-alpha-methyltransferase
MPASFEVLKETEATSKFKEEFALDVLIGLSETPKKIPSKYFYDHYGSILFQKITELPEYYLTNSEFEIFEDYKDEIANVMKGTYFNVVELGPGDARKTQVLLDRFLELGLEFQYVPIDISQSAMEELIETLNARFPSLEVSGLVARYSNALNWLKNLNSHRNLVLFLGSNIGNFNRSASTVFLRTLWNSLNHNDRLLIGFDLKKDIDLLLDAYNDSKGVTRDFNLNLLRRINTELGGNFDLSKFRHYCNYDVFSGAMESYLVSREKQNVFIRDLFQSFSFDPWEPIHLEYSYKYLESDIEQLAVTTGYVIEHQYYDSRHYFTDCIWKVNKSES